MTERLIEKFSLAGKRLLITGGSRGLGFEMALAIAEAGADVILVGRDEKSLREAAGRIRQESGGRTVDCVIGDVGDSATCESICSEIAGNFGPVDILINNVGGRLIDIPTEALTTEDWKRILDLNLTSTFIFTREIGASMISRGKGGRIINVASISGMIANRGIGGRSYETSKAAVIQFTKTVAADWAVHGITANAICPGGFMTGPNQRWARENPEVMKTFEDQIPAGKFGEPEDLGPLAVYLASDASRYMTGATLAIDGGYTLW